MVMNSRSLYEYRGLMRMLHAADQFCICFMPWFQVLRFVCNSHVMTVSISGDAAEPTMSPRICLRMMILLILIPKDFSTQDGFLFPIMCFFQNDALMPLGRLLVLFYASDFLLFVLPFFSPCPISIQLCLLSDFLIRMVLGALPNGFMLVRGVCFAATKI